MSRPQGIFCFAVVFLHSIFLLAGDPPRMEKVAPGVTLILDDNGNWGGPSMGTTHQHEPDYQAMKIINLSGLPQDILKRAREARLRVYFAIQDYSWHDLPKANGLDESFEVIVNGKTHTYATNGGFIAKAVQTEHMRWAWQDFAIPLNELIHGENRFIFKKAPLPPGPPSKSKYDDYIYVGIDNTAHHGNSMMSRDGGKTWSSDALNAIGASGEYMVRLALIEKDLTATTAWQKGVLEDPARIIGYLRFEGASRSTPDAIVLDDKEASIVLEFDSNKLDRMSPPSVIVETVGVLPDITWVSKEGKQLRAETKKSKNTLTSTLLPSRLPVAELVVRGTDAAPVNIRSITLRSTLAYLPEEVVNICPQISSPRGAAVDRHPSVEIEGTEITLANPHLRCRFVAGEGLHFASLYNEYAQAEMLLDDTSPIFLVEIGGNRYRGSANFLCKSAEPLSDGRHGFRANLFLAEHSLGASLVVSIDEVQMRWALTLTNQGSKPLDFKAAFPVLCGLAYSRDPSADYYFFPMGGGIIAPTPAIIQQGYGDHAALYQVMDVFSPERGAGLSVRAEDPDGRFKVLALRKSLPGRAEKNCISTLTPTTDEYKWTTPSVVTKVDSLQPTRGVSLAFEYLRRTREPGRSFVPCDIVFEAHPGDWHVAMKRYAEWAHKVWKFRPYPSRLDKVVNMIAAGWGQSPLFKDGQYRTDFIKPMTDCIELMSWWDWSPLGPWSTPFDRLKDVLGEATYNRWKPYFVKDPVTGQMMWNNQPGDYDGYNERFGGLPAFRKAIQTYKAMGALVTLYTDPFRMDDASKVGRKFGKQWGVVKADGEYSKAYEVWNPCHDAPEVRQWVAETMKRVMRETGADGIRLDEYGHRGWACFSKLHSHTFAEPGCTEWQRAVSEATKMVRAGMDEVAPGSVLTTEHPGYDYLMQFLEGCITYDLTVQATELRPLECNLQRFYFPECKPYELDHRRADPHHLKRFWNAVASFGAYYPRPMYTILKENHDAFSSRDCEPLVPTLAEYVYANRFSAPNKTIFLLYNARGFTVDAPLLEAKTDPNQHYFDLLDGKDLTVAKIGERSALALRLGRDQVACIARLPRLLAVKRQGDLLTVTVNAQGEKLAIVAAAKDGTETLRQDARPGENLLRLPAPSADTAPPSCIKLLREGTLLDAAQVP